VEEKMAEGFASGPLPTVPWGLSLPDAEDASPPTGDEWESHYAYTLGLQAYIYGFPWMYLAQIRWLWTSEGGKKLAEAQQKSMPWAPLNSFFNVDHLAKPEDQTGGSPNHDTLYSVAWLDLAAEPMVISVPAITDRFWCMQMCCIDSDNFTYIGSKATGNAEANYLVGGPGWHGAVPADVLDALPRARTPAVLIFGRTGVNDDADGAWICKRPAPCRRSTASRHFRSGPGRGMGHRTRRTHRSRPASITKTRSAAGSP
jgi:hypothetical protein